jgi:hypothetical protein
MFLSVVAVWLLWRVWRLEYLLEAFDRALMRKGDVDWLQGALNENLSRCVAGSEQRIASLASALGYEWKRTDAKEGWEKKVTLAEALKETCGGGTPFASSFRTVHYDDIPKYTLDRRKADRRKPAPDIFVSKPCAKCDARAAKEAVESVERDINRPWTKADLKSVFGPGGKKPAKKKPRRAH